MGAKRKALRVTVVITAADAALERADDILNGLIDSSPAAAALTAERMLKQTTVLRAESCDLIDRPDDIY